MSHGISKCSTHCCTTSLQALPAIVDEYGTGGNEEEYGDDVGDDGDVGDDDEHKHDHDRDGGVIAIITIITPCLWVTLGSEAPRTLESSVSLTAMRHQADDTICIPLSPTMLDPIESRFSPGFADLTSFSPGIVVMACTA